MRAEGIVRFGNVRAARTVRLRRLMVVEIWGVEANATIIGERSFGC